MKNRYSLISRALSTQIKFQQAKTKIRTSHRSNDLLRSTKRCICLMKSFSTLKFNNTDEYILKLFISYCIQIFPFKNY